MSSRTLPNPEADACLMIDQLQVSIGAQTPVRSVSLAVAPKSVHCLVGDSGSGKTLTSLASVGLLPRDAHCTGSIRLASFDEDLLTLGQQRWSSLRGSVIGYVGQNALGCLHPAFRIETQLIEAIRRHQPISRSEARRIALAELEAVELSEPEIVARSHPAELSGGMCQRVAIAIALCNRPSVLIADEPTTALDDETQARILELLRTRVDRDGLGVLLITHDRSVVDRMADDTTTIVEGVSVDTPPVRATSRPLDDSAVGVAERSTEPVLEVVGVDKAYGRRGWRRGAPKTVLRDVNLTAPAESTIGLVGRSGAGKTTLAQIIAGVLPPTSGEVRIAGRLVTGPDCVGRTEKASLVQYVFQNPFGSLNPRRSALMQVAEPLIAGGVSTAIAKDRARELLADVGLTAIQIDRLPTTLSGGQCQRVGIARALIRRPQVVVLDEPVSALDWSIRDEILAILAEQQSTVGALYLLISHDRALIERQSDHIYEVEDGDVRLATTPARQPEFATNTPPYHGGPT